MPYMLTAIVFVIVTLSIFTMIRTNQRPQEQEEERFLREPNVLSKAEDGLEKYAMNIAAYHSDTEQTNCKKTLLQSLEKSYGQIIQGYEYLSQEGKSKREIVPAGEWLLDNLYLIEKEYKGVKENMPEAYYRELPVLKKGIMKGYPRVYQIAMEMVNYAEGKLEGKSIERFISAYQEQVSLTSGELWALPMMLKIAFIQNISHVTTQVMENQVHKKQAEQLAERIIQSISEGRIKEELQRIKETPYAFSPTFMERLIRVLRDNGVEAEEVHHFIQEKLEAKEIHMHKVMAKEQLLQANYQLLIGNSINSIRKIEALDWKKYFETLSAVEKNLRKDPAKVYAKMDFESRDYYRHKVEKLAKYMQISETYVAKKAVECALEAEEVSDQPYLKHVGYYLIDKGVQCLKEKLGFQDKELEKWKNKFQENPVTYYLSSIFIGTFLLMCFFIVLSLQNDLFIQWWKYGIAVLALLIPCSEVVISILHWSVTHLVPPRFVPKMEFKEGIPEEYSTAVIIPTLLNTPKRAEELIKEMEVYYLANKDKNLSFVLLGDFKDSNQKEEPGDALIIETALKAIKDLNQKYCAKGEEQFFFLHRYRQFNEKENKWLGWERKRGKIMEFNQFLRGNLQTSYNIVSEQAERLQKVQYIITLDADTQLPRETAKKLVGAMAHLLNHPYIDKKEKRVLRGYGLMQPRISVSILSAQKTFFSKIFSGETGIDQYTTAVSDVYQDLFGEGTFTGKGIFHVDTFEGMLQEEIPENAVLSHDLLEGSYVRTALLTDVELMDGYPAYYNASCKRLHRWVRGDWQLLPWLMQKTVLNSLAKWKIFDNLRRSLVAPSIVILLLLMLGGILPDGTEKWFVAAVLALGSPLLFDVSEVVAFPIKGISLSGKISSKKMLIEQIFLIFTFLPYQAYLMMDAIARTLYRLYISKKNLLEWQTAADVERKAGRKVKDFIFSMWQGSAIAIVMLLLAFNRSIEIGFIALPSCFIWFLSPWIAYIISKEYTPEKVLLTKEQKQYLRRIARKTYAYFQDFVNEENNWLGPDNFQEDPFRGVAHRTSPTNMGMALTAPVVALDMGYIGIIEGISSLEKTMTSMETLQTYKGHFYNWYDTKTKEPLFPRYISTVDSGNLVGYLWLIAQSLEEYKIVPILTERKREGLLDTLYLAQEELCHREEASEGNKPYEEDIKKLQHIDLTLPLWEEFLSSLQGEVEKRVTTAPEEEVYWNKKLRTQIAKELQETHSLFPWRRFLTEKAFSKEDIEKDTVLKDIVQSLEDMGTAHNLLSLQEEMKQIEEKIHSYLKKKSKKAHRGAEVKGLLESVQQHQQYLKALHKRIGVLIDKMKHRVAITDFTLMYHKERKLFSIGYNIEQDSLGDSYYDLFASESRQASFMAIAKGEIEQNHWFQLGRAMTSIGRDKGLVSWTGTMFEYFMPFLIMKSYPETLWAQTYQNVLEGQKEYGRKRKVPWGISESAYHYFDVNLNYQYKAFGVPGIGLKRGLAKELVISPYSTVMALQQDRAGAYENLLRLKAEGAEGKYGFFEAIDYTKERLKKGKEKFLVKCFMIHHQGMSLMALDNVLHDSVLQQRFHAIPEVKATELLLQEKQSNRVIYDRELPLEASKEAIGRQKIMVRKYTTAKTVMPEAHFLSNGSYGLMLTNSGTGYSKKEEVYLYRWRPDVMIDQTGLFFYLREAGSSSYWSNSYAPCKKEGEGYEVTFSLDRGEFIRKDGEIITKTVVAIAPEDNLEIRKIILTNEGNTPKCIEVTSYCEVTLAGYDGDLVHPAFSNLFVQTEYIEEMACLLATRRPRAQGKKQPWLMQSTVVEGRSVGELQYETSRIHFIGRGENVAHPVVMKENKALSNTVGAVLDPILSMRRTLRIEPGEQCSITYIMGVEESKEEVIKLAQKYKEIHRLHGILEGAWTQAQTEMKYLGIKSAQANLYQTMASRILFLNSSFREREEFIKKVRKGQSALWKHGISGDLPIVLAIIKEEKDADLIRQLLTAHEYWSWKGIKVDLVILNLQPTSYTQPLQNTVLDLIASGYGREKQNKPGGIFIYSLSTMELEDMDFLKAIASLVFDAQKGSLAGQVKKEELLEQREAHFVPKEKAYEWQPTPIDPGPLAFYNELGGFNEVRNNYTILLKEGKNTPAPWINVISNGAFGFHVSERGAAYTWYENSRENKLTPWSNDWVSDPATEALYLRDEVTGKVWSITAAPIRDKGEYLIEHGFGYSTFQHEAEGILGSMTLFAPKEERVKICSVKLKNLTKEKRFLSLTYYAELVLGVVAQHTKTHIVTYTAKDQSFAYANNSYSGHFSKVNAYLTILGGEEQRFTGSRAEFISPSGTLEKPEALQQKELSNTVGAGLDPCLAAQSKITIEPFEEKEVVILFGATKELQQVERVIQYYKEPERVQQSLQEIQQYWESLLHTIEVKTPDKSMDIMLNGWLMYQNLSCRIWARTAFYQSGGAYGFRDQLQDVMPLAFLDPKITKKQILYSASRQFMEGDVQHWWHPIIESGIRTRFSDDLLWLPYVTVDYIKNTGDYSILEEKVGYLEDTPLQEGEDERYNIARVSEKVGSLYEHCVKAIERGLRFGPHDIPLMGSGDWNDGMSTVGNQGRGESVWLGWFLYDILKGFKELCSYKGEKERAEKYETMQHFIQENLEKNAWDGAWYRRAYFDDGTPLGSKENEECKIDSLSQSWAILSRAAKEERIKTAMASLEQYLVKEEEGMILLLTPPFYESSLEPGYIKGYVPGVRENGGQYTHAATWVILALTRLQQGEKAWKYYHMINPINHTSTLKESEKFKTEPYVMTADVYDKAPHVGRGGWSWYTGTAGWMYRVGIEGILGLKLKEGKGFTLEPCIPEAWPGYEMTYRKENCTYEIQVERGVEKGIWINENKTENSFIPFEKEGEYKVKVVI